MILFTALCFAADSVAAPQYFDAGVSSPLTWDDGTETNWSSTTGAPYDEAWVGGSGAVFEGTAGTVTVSGAIASVDSVTFDTAGYTLDGGTVTLTGSASVSSAGDNTINSTIGGAAGLSKQGAGVVTLGAANSYTGVTDITAGTLKLGNNASLGATGAGNGTTIGAGATLDLNGRNIQNEAISVAGTITNTGGDQQSALRNVTLTGNSTFTGTGRWDIRGGGANLYLNGFTAIKNGSNKTAFVSGTVHGGGNITLEAGTLAFSRSTWTTGTLTVTGGTLHFENNNATHSYTMGIALNGGSILANGSNSTTVASDIAVSGAMKTVNVSSNRLNLTGEISGTAIKKTGSGTLIISNANNNYGETELGGGVLAILSTAKVGNGTSEIDLRGSGITIQSWDANDISLGNYINISSGANYGSATTGNITFTGNANGGGGAKTLTINNDLTSFDGVVAGNSSAFTKNGAGRLEFNNMSNTFTKPVIVNDGELGGIGMIRGAVTINSGGTLAPGQSIGVLTVTNTLTLGGTADYELDASLAGANDSDRIEGITDLLYGGILQVSLTGGTLTEGQSWDLFDFTTQSGTFANDAVFGTAGDGTQLPTLTSGVWDFDYGSGTLSVVPEPSALVLVALGLVSLISCGRRRKR